METKVFSAYNEESKRVISPRLAGVDAEREPLKVLKILMEGLAADARSGIWLINFTGIPVARSHSAFDLIYLDDEHRVVHAVEISERSEFKPFKGQPSSALIVIPTTISRSKTFTGDRITINFAEQRTVDSEAPASKRTPHFPSRIVAAFSAKTFNVPAEGIQAAQATSAVSGRLMRNGSLALDQSPLLRPAAPPEVAHTPETKREAKESNVVPISGGARVPLSDAELLVTQETPKKRKPKRTISDCVPSAASISPERKQVAPLLHESIPGVPVAALFEEEIAPSAEQVAAPSAADVDAVASPEADVVPPVAQSLIDQANQGAPTSSVPAPEAVEIGMQPRTESIVDLPAAEEQTSPILPVTAPSDAESTPAGDDTPSLPMTASIEADITPESGQTLVAHSFPSENVVAYVAHEPALIPDVLTDDEAIEYPSLAVPGEVNPDDAWLLAVRGKAAQNEPDANALAELKHRWDVRLMYKLFPELHPSYRPEFQTPIVDFRKSESEIDSKLSTKVQVLNWLYPELELDTVQEKQRRHRRAPRIPEPGLVGFYFAGGESRPHEVKNLSVMGFYMVTQERWLKGTVIRMTLQIKDSDGDPADTITVLSRVVNWDESGGGFEFVYPGFID